MTRIRLFRRLADEPRDRQNQPRAISTRGLIGSSKPQPERRETIAKNRNTFEKHRREMDKKAKAEAKRLRRNERKQAVGESHGAETDEAPASINVDRESRDDSDTNNESS